MNLLITGFSGHLGQAVAELLMHDNPFGRVFGVDRVTPRLLGPVYFVHADIRTVDLADLLVLDGIDVVLHLAYADGLGPGGPRDEPVFARRLLEATRLADTRRLVTVSRDWVYADIDGMRSETSPLRTAMGPAAALIGAKVRAEALWTAACAEEPAREVVTLRIPAVLGPARDRLIDHALGLPWLVGPRDATRTLQFLHVDDTAKALLAAATAPGLNGPYNVAGAEPIGFDVVAGILEKRLVRPSPWLVRPLVGLFWRARGVPIRYADLGWFHSSAPMSSARFAREAGFRPRYSTRQALAAWRVRYRALAGGASLSEVPS